jgi:hypothetical protein
MNLASKSLSITYLVPTVAVALNRDSPLAGRRSQLNWSS